MPKADPTKMLLSVTRRLFIALVTSLSIALAIGFFVSYLKEQQAWVHGGRIIGPG
jgi:hypothetical protein